MFEFSNGFAGTVTITCLIGLGIFIYPWLLRHHGGALAVGAMTALLTVLFHLFDRGSSVATAASVLLALLWALGPVLAGVIVYRLQRGTPRS